ACAPTTTRPACWPPRRWARTPTPSWTEGSLGRVRQTRVPSGAGPGAPASPRCARAGTTQEGTMPTPTPAIAGTYYLVPKQTLQLRVGARSAHAGCVGLGAAWKSSNAAIASVDDTGLVTAQAAGMCVISADLGGGAVVMVSVEVEKPSAVF